MIDVKEASERMKEEDLITEVAKSLLPMALQMSLKPGMVVDKGQQQVNIDPLNAANLALNFAGVFVDVRRSWLEGRRAHIAAKAQAQAPGVVLPEVR